MVWMISDSLIYLRFEIKRLEDSLKFLKDVEKREEMRWLINKDFLSGIEILRYAKPGEIDKETEDFFLGRTRERPDLVKARELIEKAKSRNGLQRIWDDLRWWWVTK